MGWWLTAVRGERRRQVEDGEQRPCYYEAEEEPISR